MAYNVKLDIFEGPLALLLYLIKKNRVDIYDIPISTITEQYLEYLEVMRTLNLEVAGEFLLMASTLLHIKSRMLLPADTSEEDDTTEEDPREELVRRLIEYQRFRLAGEELLKRRLLGRDVFKRGLSNILDGLKEEDQKTVVEELSILELVSAFREILKRLPKESGLEFTVDRFRVTDRINSILDVLSEEESVRFDELFLPTSPRGEVIVTFLAILELARLRMIRINQSADGIIRLYRADRGENHYGKEP